MEFKIRFPDLLKIEVNVNIRQSVLDEAAVIDALREIAAKDTESAARLKAAIDDSINNTK